MASEQARDVFAYIGANVYRARVRVGLTQERLAEKAELDLRFLQRVERGKTNLSIATLVSLADALDVTPGSLLKKAVLPEVQRGRPPSKKRTHRA